MRYLLSCILIILFSPVNANGQVKENRPNVIIFFTDDQGYQDVGVFGSPLIKTPNLDKMAADGIRFTDFYSASPVCSPSRAALLTGAYPPRVQVPVVLWPRSKSGLPSEEVTIAEMLKEKGYATACIGKWHLGDQERFLPTSQGFDSYLGIPYSNDMSVNPNFKVSDAAVFREGMTLDSLRHAKPKKFLVPLLRDEEVIEYPVNQSLLTQKYTEEAISFMTKNKENPFFLYIPHTMPHIPLYVSEPFQGKSKRGLYGDVIEELDWSIGEVLKTLESLGLAENTLVIFTSDNGPWNLKNGQGGSALPLRGHKFSTYEGGMRVPMIAQWKGKIPAGSVCDQVASTIDLLPTIAALTGAELPEEKIDGKDIWPLLAGKRKNSPHRKSGYYYYVGKTAEAVRKGKWKLRRRKGVVELYNLEKDIAETTNLAEAFPKRARKLIRMLEDFDAGLQLDNQRYQ